MESMASEIAIKTDANNLGKLVELPAEIRFMIWQNMRPQNDRKFKSDMSILRTCHQLYDEVANQFYYKEILDFNISPLYKYGSWIHVTNQLGVVWPLASLRDAISLGFDKLPYHKLEGINIQIQAPDQRDPGQMICLWTKVREFSELLSQVGELPEINIYLQDTEHSKWVKNGKSQKSIPAEGTDFSARDFDFDYEIVLTELCRLRNARKVKIHVSEDLMLKCASPISSHESMMFETEGSGTYLNLENDSVWCGPGYQEDMDDTFRQLDLALDELPGKTARMMRLQRFSSWYDDNNFGKSRYMDELERVMKLPVYTYESYNNLRAIKWRYLLMVAFNPLSAKMQKMRFQEHMYEMSLTPGQLFKMFPEQHPWGRGWSFSQWAYYFKTQDSHKSKREQYKRLYRDVGLRDRWDHEEWHRYYPRGIPPLGRNLFMFEVEMGQVWLEESLIEPRERFQGWDDVDLPWERQRKR